MLDLCKVLQTQKTKENRNKHHSNSYFQDPTLHLFTPIQTPVINQAPAILQPQATTPSSTPAFLSRFPRSLSSLSLGGKKKSTDKDPNATSPNNSGNAEMLSPSQSSSGHHLHHHQHPGHYHHPPSHSHHHNISLASVKSKFTGSTKDLKNSADHPPPLPQRNFPRKSQPSPITTTSPLDGVDGEVVLRRNTQISDLDHSFTATGASNNNISHSTGSANDGKTKSSSGGKGKKRNKTKIKANSDPKISTQLFIQMEKAQSIDYDNQQIIAETGHSVGNEPPPLPPRQPGMLEENQNLLNNNKLSNSGSAGSRPAPNSLDTLLNYPLIATCTAVRDNISAFPLSHRPNIVQQLQQNNNNNNNNTAHQHYLQTSSSSTVSNVLLSLSVSRSLSSICYNHNTHTHAHSQTHVIYFIFWIN